MNLMNFNNEMKERVGYINQILVHSLPKKEDFQKEIYEAMEYSLVAPGKRIRPILMLETFRLFGGKEEEMIKPFISAIEMIHTYSLVHDDLPAMDNDDYRRGRLTTHKKYGEAMGILTGDGLLNYAVEMIATSFEKAPVDMYPYLGKALGVMMTKTGVYGMIGGQVIDIYDSGNTDTKSMDKELRINRLLKMYELKTSALIEASMMVGAILAKAKEEEINVVEISAKNLGIAFQIQDDILDLTSSQDVLGKPTRSDEKNEKETYVSLKGMEQAVIDVEAYSNTCLNALYTINYENEFLVELVKSLIKRTR